MRADPTAPCPSTYAAHFFSLDAAYQQVFRIVLAEVRTEIESQLRGVVPDVEAYDDFLVLNRKFTVVGNRRAIRAHPLR